MDIRKLDTYNKSYLEGIERSSQFSYSTQYFWWKKYATLEKILAKLLQKAESEKPIRIMDIGCQIGHDIFKLSERFQSYNIQWFGCDINPDFLKICNLRKAIHTNHQFRFFISKIECFSCKFQQFDIVICSEVLEHIENLGAALVNIAGIMNRTAYFIMSTPNSNNYALKVCGFVSKKIIKGINREFRNETAREFAYKSEIGANTEIEHINLQTMYSLKKKLTASGFKIQGIRRGAMFYGSKFIDKYPTLFAIIIILDRLFDYCAIFDKWAYNYFLIMRKPS